jgi:hypothetical protein
MSITPATWKIEVGRSQASATLGKCMRSYLKNKLKAKKIFNKRTRGIAQVVESLLRKHKALSSIPNTWECEGGTLP